MAKSTMVELVDELRKLPKSKEIDLMIEEALAGEYHDYKNQKYACGKFESATRLDDLGHYELANRIKSGEFDEEADETDKSNMRDMLSRSGMGALKPLLGL
jgi:hypothetical protein